MTVRRALLGRKVIVTLRLGLGLAKRRHAAQDGFALANCCLDAQVIFQLRRGKLDQGLPVDPLGPKGLNQGAVDIFHGG